MENDTVWGSGSIICNSKQTQKHNGSSIDVFLVVCLLLVLFVTFLFVCVHSEIVQGILVWQNDSGHKSLKDRSSVTCWALLL